MNETSASSAFKNMRSAFWEFFFNMTHISSMATFWFWILWVLEKLQVLAPSVMFVFYQTPWDDVSSVARYFNIVPYFSSYQAFTVFSYVLFAVVQGFVAAGVYQLVQTKRDMARGHFLSNYSVMAQTAHFGTVCSAKVLLQACTALLGYAIRSLAKSFEVSEFKGISSSLAIKGTWNSYLLIVVLIFMLLELLGVSLIHILFCQDRGLKCRLSWSANNFYADFGLLAIQLIIQCNYVLVPTTDKVVSFAILVVCGCQVVLTIWYTKWDSRWVDNAEFFYSMLLFMTQVLIVICDTLGLSTLADTYQYFALLPGYAALCCIIRSLSRTSWIAEKPKKDDEAVELLKELVALSRSMDNSKAATAKLLILLCSHCKDCIRTDCECRYLKSTIRPENHPPAIPENTKIYHTSKDLPGTYNKGYLIKSLKLLVGELEAQFNKSDYFCIALAELRFHYFANHYYALEQLSLLSSKKPNILLRQRAYNLWRSIAIGLERTDDGDDLERTAASIDYLKAFHTFLKQAEESRELTIKFWSVLLKEAPSAQELNEIGKVLFKSKYNIMKTVETISRISSNNMEFLLRYGLLMKYVMHDFVAAEQAAKKLIYVTESAKYSAFNTHGFSIFRTDEKVMFLLASLNDSRSATIKEVNTEFENGLGYSRKDIIGRSVTNIMPPTVAQKHAEYVQRFFQTMDAKNINTVRLRFVKNSESQYVPCKILMKIVPRLTAGLQIALFMINDSRISMLTRFKRDKTGKKTGAILCDTTYKITGLSKDAVDILKLSKVRASDLVKNGTLFDLFPILEKGTVLTEFLGNGGRVFAFSFEHSHVDFTSEDELSPEKLKTNLLLWGRLVQEEYGEGDKSYIFLISDVLPEDVQKYAPDPNIEGLLEEKSNGGFRSYHSTLEPNRERQNVKEVDKDEWKMLDTGSVTSVVSVSIVSSNSELFSETANQIRIHNVVKQTPASIKKLCGGIIFILLGIIALIISQMFVSLDENNYLMKRFDLIQVYHLRYKLNVGLASMAAVYMPYLKKTPLAFNQFSLRLIGRTDTVSDYNVRTRALMYSQNLDYETEPIIIPDLPSGERTVTFSHSQLIYVNMLIECVSYGKYEQVSSCLTQTNNATCIRINTLLSAVYNMLFYHTRFKQDEVSSRLEEEIKVLARKGEKSQYIIIAVCTGLVVISLIAIMPIFAWVIKDKSYVLTIFSDIIPEEIEKTIKMCKELDLRTVHCKKKWLADFEKQPNMFWDKLILAQKRGSVKSAKKEVSKSYTKTPAENLSHAVIAKDKNDITHEEGENNTINKNPAEIRAEDAIDPEELLSAEQRRQKRRTLLGETDVTLRWRSICRLILVASLFLAYASTNIYFNYYAHHVNGEAVEVYFALHKRNVFTTLLAVFAREAQKTGNKLIVSSNPNKENGKLYMMDIINMLLEIESLCQNFRKHASETVYKNYLSLLKRAESAEFCNVSDSYNYSQTIPCSKYYLGPLNQGLSVAIAYIIDFYTQFSNMIQNSNYSDPEVAAAIRADGTLTTFAVYVASYTSPVQEYLLIMFYDDAVAFFKLVNNLVIAITTCFLVIFTAVYLGVFITFIDTLKSEIWETHGILNMIPMFILEGNPKVKEQVINRNRVK